MRTVLDTNVLLSALFTRGVCEALLDVIIESGACRRSRAEPLLFFLAKTLPRNQRCLQSAIAGRADMLVTDDAEALRIARLKAHGSSRRACSTMRCDSVTGCSPAREREPDSIAATRG